jgi:hypothetical protein
MEKQNLFQRLVISAKGDEKRLHKDTWLINLYAYLFTITPLVIVVAALYVAGAI